MIITDVSKLRVVKVTNNHSQAVVICDSYFSVTNNHRQQGHPRGLRQKHNIVNGDVYAEFPMQIKLFS